MLQAPAWGLGLFKRILEEFNQLNQEKLLGVRMVPTDQEPQRNGLGANVRFDVTNGPCPFFNSAGKDETDTLDTSPGHIKGRCLSVITGSAKLPFVWKAFVFLPANPRVNAARAVGERVKMALALHELFHACGLHEEDPGHGKPNQPDPGELDLFATGGIFMQGSTPDKDALFIGGKTVPNAAGRFTITARTASLAQSVWLFGHF
jgi:hypothetical protein